MNVWKVRKSEVNGVIKDQIEDACKLFIADRLINQSNDEPNLDNLYNLLKVRINVLDNYPED